MAVVDISTPPSKAALTDAGAEFVAHFGVKGMRWGVRNDDKPRPEVKRRTEDLPDVITSRGEKLSIVGGKIPGTARLLGRLSERVRKKIDAASSYTFKNSKGEAVGVMTLQKKSADELNVIWIDVEEEHRGKGYATAAMKGAVTFAKKQKVKRVTLEVPGNSPDARHIYEKLGFKINPGQKAEFGDAVWGGLTDMTLDLEARARHEAVGEKFLAHYGVKGMRWGVIRDRGPGLAKAAVKKAYMPSTDAKKASVYMARAKLGGVRNLDNREMQAVIQRMALEKQYKELYGERQWHTAGKKWAGKFLTDVAKSAATSWLSNPFAKGQTRDQYRTQAWSNGQHFAGVLEGGLAQPAIGS